jgi:hypothetical protein
MVMGLFTFDVEKADEEVQMELTDIQCNSIFKQKFCEVGVPSFCSLLPRD